jgi:hypothetical protein
MNHHDYSGVFIPRLVLEDARLCPASRILFGLLDGLGRSERGCWASSRYLSGICGVKPRQLRNHLATLERLGYVTRKVSARNQRSLFTVTTKALEGVKQGGGGRQLNAGGVGNSLPPYRIGDKDNPLTPLKGGQGKRSLRGRNKTRLTGADYSNGF